ncbi:MAG: FAD-dependent monooxygenase, partial [Candidatus Dormibacteraeota bacterium]|nr:FAD-dependent monooxygenase [Candidatus Dormibacteraeota bacterium]
FGQEVWHELRGTDAGHEVPQFSIHRGHLQGVLYNAVRARLGEDAVRTDRRLVRFEERAGGVDAVFVDRTGREVERARGDVLIGADGIRSTVRAALNPGEGDPLWNGAVLWRGTRDWPAFLTGRSMLIAGGMQGKVVVYPIGPGETPATRLTNWAVIGVPEQRADRRLADWSRPGSWDELRPFVQHFRVAQVDVAGLIGGTSVFYEYPLCDRDPLPRWSWGRVTLLGDAAHPMYPVGSNGASQAILDARCLADRLAEEGVEAGLAAYDQDRRPATAAIVESNRSGGPEGVIDAVEALAPDGFEDVDAVLPHAERERIVRGYARTAGFAAPAPRAPGPAHGGGAMTNGWKPAVTKADGAVEGISWNILGQIYVPKHVDEQTFTWHATFPPGTFVPPHVHPTQDEFVYMLSGEMEAELDGAAPEAARAGDLIELPRGVPHGLFNRSGRELTCLFWVTPTRRLFDLFRGIDALSPQTPEAVVALSAEHEVNFLPPPE